MRTKYLLIGAALLLLVLALAACQPAPAPAVEATPCPTAEPCPACPTCPTPPAPVVQQVPFQDEWAGSPHNDTEAEAFNHWNEDDPAEVPVDCAKCHTTAGHQDYVGADGSAVNVVDKPVPAPAGTIQCVACHNEATVGITSVVFPSGAEVAALGSTANCLQCHQGRESKVSVDQAITDSGAADDDTVSDKLGFKNIHYFAAAATLYGTQVKGGYEYDGKSYDFKNDHVAGFNTCVGCHNQHTLELRLEKCAECHQGVASVEDVEKIRMQGSLVDYDGDGDVTEGMASEIQGLGGMLYQAIQAYAKDVAGAPIGYNPDVYPYFFSDTNGDGEISEDEAVFDNAYTSWTPRLLKAAYNMQVAIKDPGQFAHGGKYIVQLLYDSIEDLNTKLATPVDLSQAHRIDAGHFAGSEEAFRHWDEEGEVPGTCVKCHTGVGLPMFLKNAATIAVPPTNGLNCSTCHNDLSAFTRYEVGAVKFPSGATLIFAEKDDSNLCINCHQGRESTVSVNSAIKAAAVGDDEVSDALRFRDSHYFAAGSTLFGTLAKGMYEYEGQEYNGRNMHVPGFDTCEGCHDAHALNVKVDGCKACHTQVQSEEDLTKIRMTPGDFDGDGDETEGMAGEIQTMTEKLYTAIQAYSQDVVGTPLAYDPGQYPYFFTDTNGNGVVDEDEANRDNAYASWTPKLLRAAYNYQYVQKDPGAFAHNGQYILQVLYDSLVEIGGDTAGLTRPAVKTTE